MRGPRRGSTAARRIARKAERTLQNTHGGYAGPSLIESLETELLEATIKYIQAKSQEYPEDEEYTLTEWVDIKADRAKKLATARGIMRGLATAVAVWRNPYTQDIKGVEKEFVRLARAEITSV